VIKIEGEELIVSKKASGKEVMRIDIKHLKIPENQAEQDGTGQPATRPESKSEGSDKSQPKSEGRSR
jgi:hypothetical protein